MDDGAPSRRGGEAPPAHLIGVGPEQEFTTARQMTGAPALWLRNIENLAALYDRPPPEPFILLLDGDLPTEELIALLDRFAALISTRPVILQMTKPPIRLVVAVMQRGVLDVLAKPYPPARLASALEEIQARPGPRSP